MVTKLKNNKLTCVLWIFLSAFLFFLAIRAYSVDSLSGYFTRHIINEENPFAIVPSTTEAYTMSATDSNIDMTSFYTVLPETTAAPGNSQVFIYASYSGYSGYSYYLLYLVVIGFIFCILGGFFFDCFHPKLPQEVFLLFLFFSLFQFLGDSLTVRFYQNFGKLNWAFLLLCFVFGFLSAVSFLCLLWSWKNHGLHASLFGEWFFKKISVKSLPIQLLFVILTAALLSAAFVFALIRITFIYFSGILSQEKLVLFATIFALCIFTVILLFFLSGSHSIASDMDALVQKSIKTTLEQEKLKVDLITNLSHDLKTPLASIIGYTEQLTRQELSPSAIPIVDKLQHKSCYLLDMVEEIFELSKASNGHLPMKEETIDIGRLLEQTLGEMDDELSASGFQLKKDYPQTGVLVLCDGLHMHRVFQNLFENALKYACPNTRIFIHLSVMNQFAEVRIKNISRVPLDFDPDEITERFVRGEKARTGEGSGLGLAIAKTYTESCHGQFQIQIEDDNFIAVVQLPMSKYESN